MLNEYLKAVPLLTISNEERTQLEALKADFENFKKEVMSKKKK